MSMLCFFFHAVRRVVVNEAEKEENSKQQVVSGSKCTMQVIFELKFLS